MSDDTDKFAGFEEFLRQQAAPVAPPMIRTAPLPASPPASQQFITRLYLPFGDVFRFTLQMTAASVLIGVGLWVVAVLLMFGLWLAR